MAEDKLREAERALNAAPTDKSAWEAYRNAYVHSGKTPCDWLDEIVRRTAAGIKNALVDGLADIENFPTTRYYVFDESLSILEDYPGHAKHDLGFDGSLENLWDPQGDVSENRIPVLTKNGLFYFATKASNLEEDKNGKIDTIGVNVPGDQYFPCPDDFKEYDLAYILNTGLILDGLYQYFDHSGYHELVRSLINALDQQTKFGAELIKEEINLHIGTKKMPQMEFGKKHPALKRMIRYDGHIEKSPGFYVRDLQLDHILATPQGIFKYDIQKLTHELRDGRIVRLDPDRVRAVPCEFSKEEVSAEDLYEDGKEYLEKVINYECPEE